MHTFFDEFWALSRLYQQALGVSSVPQKAHCKEHYADGQISGIHIVPADEKNEKIKIVVYYSLKQWLVASYYTNWAIFSYHQASSVKSL